MMNGSQQQRSVEISRATADEAASIASALHQAFAEYQSLYTAEAFAITTPSPAEIGKQSIDQSRCEIPATKPHD